MSIQGYDQWKTASPYDEDCASDFELENTIAEKRTLCPACGYHGNISVADWTVEIEKAGFPGELLHDEITFAGWVCEECGWTQEAIESDYDRLRKYKEKLQPRIDAINRAIAIRKLKPAISLDDLFADLPDDGDFNYDDDGMGDWHIYCCGERDCPTKWHKYCPTMDIGRKDGKRYVELGSTDEDGNHDFDIGYDEREGDTPESFHDVGLAIANQSDDYFRGWAEYWLECSYSGLDPANETMRKIQPGLEWIEFCIESAESFSKYLVAK
jgi:hypothetical protein